MTNYKELIKTDWIAQFKPSLQQLIKRAVNKEIDFTDLLNNPDEEFEETLNKRIIQKRWAEYNKKIHANRK